MAQSADVVVLTALQLEADPYRDLLNDVENVTTAHRRYFRGTVAGRSVVVWPILGVGNVRAAVSAQLAITVWNPAYLLLSGITGGFKASDIELGDVLAPEQIVSYEPEKVRDAKSEQRFEVYRPSDAVVKAARYSLDTDWTSTIPASPPKSLHRPPKVHFGIVFSGEKVIASKKWADAFREKWPRLSGVEMESIGVLQASYESGEAPRAGVVKSVSDWADVSKGDKWQAFAAASAAAFVVAIVGNAIYPKDRRQPQHVNSSLSAHAPASLKKGWGPKKVELCRRLGATEQRELADCFEIEPHIKEGFDHLAYCSSVWDYLQKREKLSELPAVLRDCLKRDDLIPLIEEYCI